jgi:hypothetical protein
MPDATENGIRLRNALQSLEKALATPAIEGELAEWGRAVQDAWSEAAACIRASVDVAHRKQMKDIAETDPEMFKRIEEIGTEDNEIRRLLHKLDNDVPRVIRALPIAEKDPAARVNEEQEKLVNEGLAFVSRVRKQDVVVQTWLVEAFNRERGTGD